MPKNSNPTIPVYGSAQQIVDDLHKMAEIKKPAPPQTVEPNTGSKNIKSLLIFLLVIITATAIFLYQNKEFGPGNLIISTRQDETSNRNIKEATGYDWQNPPKSGSKEEKLAALLLLHEEETAAFQLSTNRAQNIILKKQDLGALNITNVDQEPTKENSVNLVENLIKIHEFYSQKGNEESITRISRLQVLKKYMSRYEFEDSEQIPEAADKITLGTHPAENQKDLLLLLLNRFNNWFTFVQNVS